MSTYSKEEATDVSFLAGKTVLLTGATSGLGAACIDAFCAMPGKPKKVLLVVRSESKAEATSEQLRAAGIEASVYLGNMSSPKDVLRVCREIKAAETVLHVLGVNAGMFSVASERVTQEDGLEVHMATNFLHMVLMVEELTPLLESTANASGATSRICVMGSYTTMSMSEGTLHFEHMWSAEGPIKGTASAGLPDGSYMYSQSKLAQHAWIRHAATALPATVTINVCCPGSVFTNIEAWVHFAKFMGWFWPVVGWYIGMRTPEVGRASYMHLLGAPAMEGLTGKYCDFGYKSARLVFNKPTPVDTYPSEGMRKAPTTSDAALCKKVYDETAQLAARMREKYP